MAFRRIYVERRQCNAGTICFMRAELYGLEELTQSSYCGKYIKMPYEFADSNTSFTNNFVESATPRQFGFCGALEDACAPESHYEGSYFDNQLPIQHDTSSRSFRDFEIFAENANFPTNSACTIPEPFHFPRLVPPPDGHFEQEPSTSHSSDNFVMPCSTAYFNQNSTFEMIQRGNTMPTDLKLTSPDEKSLEGHLPTLDVARTLGESSGLQVVDEINVKVLRQANEGLRRELGEAKSRIYFLENDVRKMAGEIGRLTKKQNVTKAILQKMKPSTVVSEKSEKKRLHHFLDLILEGGDAENPASEIHLHEHQMHQNLNHVIQNLRIELDQSKKDNEVLKMANSKDDSNISELLETLRETIQHHSLDLLGFALSAQQHADKLREKKRKNDDTLSDIQRMIVKHQKIREKQSKSSGARNSRKRFKPASE